LLLSAALATREQELDSLGVSVVIPAYNAGAFLSTTIDSVLAQQWPDLEVVVVDDGSTDETAALLDAYIGRYAGVFRVIHQPNLGPAAARSAGILAASRRFVAMLDHDDQWLPGKLASQIALMTRDPGLQFSATGYIYRVQGQPDARSIIDDWDDAPERVLHRLLISNCILTSTFVANRRALTEVGLFDPSIWWGDEYDLWLRIAAAGYRIGYVAEALTMYSRGSENLSTAFIGKGIDAYIPVMTKLFDAGELPQAIRARRRWYLAHRQLNNAIGYLDDHYYRETVISLARAIWQHPASVRPGWLVMLVKATAGMIRGGSSSRRT
jgi:glycosyltransferase involved in cell wall biosynthesis